MMEVPTTFRMWLCLLWLLLMMGTSRCDYASLALATDVSLSTNQPPTTINHTFCAIYNPLYLSPPHQDHPTSFHPAVYPSHAQSSIDPLGCLPINSSLHLGNVTLVVGRGNCSFYQKAIVASAADAALLVVVYNHSTVDTLPSLEPEDLHDNETSTGIPVVFIGSDSGEELKSWLSNSTAVYLSAYVPPVLHFDPSSLLLFCVAVGTVLLASFLANNPFQFLRYGLLFRPNNECQFTSDENSSVGGRKLSVAAMLIGMVIMVASTCILLLLLYFFYTPMVYIVLVLYSIASMFGLYNLLSPFLALLPLGDHLRLPPNKLPLFKYRPNVIFFGAVLFSVAVVLWWLVQRHSGYAWILQDILGFAFIAMLLSRLKFLNVWVVAVLLVLLFFYDIFMVFITPYFTSDGISVMEKAATGGGSKGGATEMLPVVFLVPKFWYPSPLESTCSAYVKTRPVSLLGYGDVGIPGLLVTLCLKFDFQNQAKKWVKHYYFTSGVAYLVGLVVTYIALALMETAQPALLYLVPATLGSVFILSLIRKEFFLFFTGKQRSSKSQATSSEATSERETETVVNPEPDTVVNPESDTENENEATDVLLHKEKRITD